MATLIFNEPYNVVCDIAKVCAHVFQKGIVDANAYCDPQAMRALAKRSEEEHYTTLQLILEGQIRELNERQYLNIIRAYASGLKCPSFINFTLHGKDSLISGACTLLDYCYRLGIMQTFVFDESRLGSMRIVQPLQRGTYLTPNGRVKLKKWIDMLRGYITIIELDTNSDVAKTMQDLDEFIATVMKMRLEIETTEIIENERRKFILNGGEL